ncbi:MAG: winged helix-turn-helix domain-containing protein [Steroidobacteraceae bacterium]
MDLIRLGQFELRPAERALSRDGQPLELGARAFDLLLVLIEHQGRLATKATLLERVWPRLVVDENNLPAQVASLRRVLGAGAIRTVPGFGYRLELPVVLPGAAPAVVAQPLPEAPRLAIPRRFWPGRIGALIGRERELAELEATLAGANLVTVVGSAGVGKTRLAHELLSREAEKSAAAVAWVSLESIDEAVRVPSAIALALGLALPDNIDGFVALRQALEQVPVLLVLDGAEHLQAELAAPLVELVTQTAGVRALLTSQAPLGIAGEVIYRLRVLALPDAATPGEEAQRYAAVELFAQRARAADQRFELNATNSKLVSDICRRLDGNALAIELAAARVPALGLAMVLERLDDRFRLLKLSGAAADTRHGALHAAFDWSYQLLTAAEQCVFNQLGAFAGSFTLQAAARSVRDGNIDAAETIDLITRLVDRSLVSALPIDPPRYTLLETARYYARARLTERDELKRANRNVAGAMLELLDAAYQEYWSLDEAVWLHRYQPELDNVRAAIDWAATQDRLLAVSLYGSAWPLFLESDLGAEGRARFEQTVTQINASLPMARVARFWEAVASLESTRKYDRARYAAELAAALHDTLNNARARYYSQSLLALNWRGDDSAAGAAFDVAHQLEDAAWPARLLAHGALTEGALLVSRGDFPAARASYQRAMRLALATSERQALAATVAIAELDVTCGDLSGALQLSRPLALSLRHSGRCETRLELLASYFAALLLSGEITEARAIGAELHELAMRLDTDRLHSALDAMAYLACLDQQYTSAARIAACADAAHPAHGQLRRQPLEERMRALVQARLANASAAGWQAPAPEVCAAVDEAAACALALGLTH